MNEILDCIWESVLMDDSNKLSELTSSLICETCDYDSFSDDIFKRLLEIIASKEFQKMKYSWYLLKVFEVDLEFLSEDQKTKLLVLLENNFEQTEDETTLLLMAEMLADLFLNKKSIEAIERLMCINSSKIQKAFVPHALSWFHRNTHDLSLKARAMSNLETMTMDSNSTVANEAMFELKKC